MSRSRSPSDIAREGTAGKRFLRGFQTTDVNGLATFTTVYPGWYSGRAVHLHVKVRPTLAQALATQLFFDDSLSDKVLAQSPYTARGQRDTRNSNDQFYAQGGSKTMLTLDPDGQGYAGTFSIGLQA